MPAYRNALLALSLLTTVAAAQRPPLPVYVPPMPQPPSAAPATQTPPAAPAPAPNPTQPAAAPQVQAGGAMVLNLQNASLYEVVDQLARQMKMNYILDPRL